MVQIHLIGISNPEEVLRCIDLCCIATFRYRIVSGVVYADHNHTANSILAWHRNVFLEMLLMSAWLYKSFPDVDLWVSFADEPSRCNLTIPVLQYTVIGMDVVRQAKHSSRAVLQDGSVVSIPQLLTGGGEARQADEPAPDFYRWVRLSSWLVAGVWRLLAVRLSVGWLQATSS
jgi:hypothetical protein